MKELTDAEIAREKEFMRGLPRVNLGALFMPPIWGPVHGFWATILYYPAMLLADNLIYAAVHEQTPLSIILAVLVSATIIGITVAFSIVSQPIAAHRAEAKGMNRAQYLKRQRIWAVISLVILIVFVALATLYNIEYRPLLDK